MEEAPAIVRKNLAGEVHIINVRHPMEVEEVFSDAVEAARKENRVYTRESMGDEPVDMDGDGIPDDVDPDDDAH